MELRHGLQPQFLPGLVGGKSRTGFTLNARPLGPNKKLHILLSPFNIFALCTDRLPDAVDDGLIASRSGWKLKNIGVGPGVFILVQFASSICSVIDHRDLSGPEHLTGVRLSGLC